jgi:hypothetical protein
MSWKVTWRVTGKRIESGTCIDVILRSIRPTKFKGIVAIWSQVCPRTGDAIRRGTGGRDNPGFDLAETKPSMYPSCQRAFLPFAPLQRSPDLGPSLL